MSFFRKASSWSSSLMPTNLSTTSPFLMASTVGTADTCVGETKGDQVTRRRTLLNGRSPGFVVKAGGVRSAVTAQAVGGAPSLGAGVPQGLKVHPLGRLFHCGLPAVPFLPQPQD